MASSEFSLTSDGQHEGLTIGLSCLWIIGSWKVFGVLQLEKEPRLVFDACRGGGADSLRASGVVFWVRLGAACRPNESSAIVAVEVLIRFGPLGFVFLVSSPLS